jgi:mycoredoxin
MTEPTDADRPGHPDPGHPVVDFYWRPGCGFCWNLKRKLHKAGVAMAEHNIWEDPDAAAVVRGAARGNETVPTVGLGGEYLVNPTAAQVQALVGRHGPGAPGR